MEKYFAQTLRGVGTPKILPVTEKRIPEGFVTVAQLEISKRVCSRRLRDECKRTEAPELLQRVDNLLRRLL